MTAILTPSGTLAGSIPAYVGIVVSPGEMVDAPHTGADVRIESYGWSDLVAATRPTEARP